MKYIELKDLTGTRLEEIAQKIVDTYNNEKKREGSETCYELQESPEHKEGESPEHKEGDYQLKVYSYRDARVTRLSQQVQTNPKKKSNSYYLLFFYKEKPALRMIAVTSGQAWSVVRHCINYEFPIRVAEKVANAQKIAEIARLCLFGNNTKETLLHPDQFELYKTQSLYYLVEAFRCEIKAGSSLSDLVGPCCIKITTGGLLRVEKKISLKEYPPMLDLFAHYVEKEKTYDSEGCEEKPDPLFEFLHFLQPAQLVKEILDTCLIRQIYKASRKGLKPLAYVRHKFLEDFLFSNRFELKIDARFQPFGSRPPEIETIIEEIDAPDEATFKEKIKTCKLRFYDKKDHPHEALLVDCLEGEVRLSNGDAYFKVRGMWYKLAADYLSLVHEDFKTVLKNGFIQKNDEGWLPRPWKGNKKGGKITEDSVKVKLVSPKGIRKFIKELKAVTVCYVDDKGSVQQQKLVGEILKIPAVSKHKDAIEKILKEGFSDQKIQATCGTDADEVIKALKEKRKVVQENSSKETYVYNPFPYPMKGRPELKGKYEAFVTFLEEMYSESENTEDEEVYNRAYLEPPYGSKNGYLVFDQICPDYIEPCDILKYTKDTVFLYHVKEKFGQHTRDACSQIINSAKMIRSALTTHQPQNYLQKLWAKATTLEENPSAWLKSVKAQIEELGEEKFLNIFRNRKVVFIYAYLPKEGKSLANEAQVKSCLAPEDLKSKEPTKLFAMLIELGYLDSRGRLTGKFLSTKKENFKLKETFEASAEVIFKQLSDFRSVSKSTLAKIEILQLAQNLQALNFEFRITEIPRPGKTATIPPSSSPSPPTDLGDLDDDTIDDSQLLTLPESAPTVEPVSKIKNGPIGYTNIGNACYMIASLQVLFNIPSFRELVTQKKDATDLTRALHRVLQEEEPSRTAALIEDLREKVFKAAPLSILEGVNRLKAQHDAHEFFLFVLEKLEWPMFETRTRFTTSLEERSSGEEEHRVLSVPLSGANFQEAINAYFSCEKMENKNTKWEQQIEIITLPDFLFVQLKRFGNDGKKDSKKMKFPSSVKVKNQEYEIIGFVNHHGEVATKGHYTADVKNQRDLAKQQWVCCDDSILREDNPSDPLTKAYLIALRKKQ